MGRSLQRESFDQVVEDALMYSGERKLQLLKQRRLEENVGALQEAERVERLRLLVHVEECKAAAVAAEEDLARHDEIAEQLHEIHADILQVLEEGDELEQEAARSISVDAAAAGFAFARKELLEPGAISSLVRQRVLAAGATPREVEAV